MTTPTTSVARGAGLIDRLMNRTSSRLPIGAERERIAGEAAALEKIRDRARTILLGHTLQPNQRCSCGNASTFTTPEAHTEHVAYFIASNTRHLGYDTAARAAVTRVRYLADSLTKAHHADNMLIDGRPYPGTRIQDAIHEAARIRPGD